MPLRQPRRAGIPLKTGQTTQYSSEEDDGYHEKGLTKRYSVLSTGDYSGVCSFTLDGKTETQSHNCVQDLVTGLMWARYASDESASVGAGADGKMAWTGTDDDIFQYAAAANVAELGGHSDWRIPNLFELALLRNMEVSSAQPDGTVFPGWPADNIWSSTTRPSLTSYAMYVAFYDGNVPSSDKTLAYYAALVRGGV